MWLLDSPSALGEVSLDEERRGCLLFLSSCLQQNTALEQLQSEERQVGHANVNLDIDIFVISEPKWLKFGLQAHFFKVFGHAKFQLSITSTFKVIKLLVKVTKYLH